MTARAMARRRSKALKASAVACASLALAIASFQAAMAFSWRAALAYPWLTVGGDLQLAVVGGVVGPP